MTMRLDRMRAAACAALVATLAACENALDVESPSRIPAELIESPANAALLVRSAVGDFECAFGAYVVMGGIVGDELIEATQTADRWPYDARRTQPNDLRYGTFGCTANGVYTPLQTARVSAERILGLLQGWTDAEVPNRTRLMATAAAHAGYALQLLGEGFCSLAVSTINPDRSVSYGGEISRDSVFRLAEARFTEAITAAQASGTTDILNMALVGRARARLYRGRYAEARADAVQVPSTFVKNMTASATSGRRENRVWSNNSATSTATSVGDLYRTLNDPRVPVTNLNRNSVTGVPLWRQDKYPTAGSPIRIASGHEAALIVAEAEIAAGNLAAADSIINIYRARGNQSAISSPDSATAMSYLIDQRRRELFLEGQHLGDYIRFQLPFSPAVGAPYHAGGVYGQQRCFPLPDVERNNNPNL
ncbi:MAG TPA: RagB/SusD family nutrient uptake outer membrane protein [Gemmatimonadales bacterium]|nr:RagB/SusD family nutrient uptake outer membrane protein [Gemmatimonadales bacterium]